MRIDNSRRHQSAVPSAGTCVNHYDSLKSGHVEGAGHTVATTVLPVRLHVPTYANAKFTPGFGPTPTGRPDGLRDMCFTAPNFA